ncbi:MAG: hypothetical protein JXX29_03445 [Deltaproteobacteria bacterium]|nr:hypothetical protein [Deltaproteobacteria bacterium]MBN2670697.1 hypothetical protein [Deltaproteobacteria bacterium]
MAKQLNWRTWLLQGDQYMNSASPKGKKSKFTPTIRYNLLSMSLESYIMAILDYHHTLPDNHTYTDLVTGLERVLEVDEELKQRLLKYENIQSICSMEKYHIKQPSESELVDLRNAILQMGALAHETCLQQLAV